MSKRKLYSLIACVAVTSLLSLRANAASTWTGGASAASPASGSWNTAGNWSPSGVPAASTELIFGGSTTYTSTNNIAAYNFGTLTLNSTASGGDTIASSGSGAFQLGNGTIQQNNTATFTISVDVTTKSNPGILNLAGSGTGVVTLSGVLSQQNANNNLSLTKSGSSVFVLSNTNSFTGGTSISNGTLRLTNSAGLGGAGAAVSMSGGNLDLASAASVNAYNVSVTGTASITSNRSASGAGITHTLGTLGIGANQLNILAGGSVTSGTAGVTFGNTTLSANGAAFDTAANTNLTLGAISGNFSFTKQGNGTMSLNSASTRSGGTSITAGTLVLGNGSALGTGSVTLGAATLNVAGVTATVGPVFINGGNVTGTTGALSLGGAVTSTGTSAIDSNVALGATRTFDVTNTLTMSKPISGSGFGINKTGTGDLVLSGNNTYTGLTDIQDGKIIVKTGGNIAGSIHVSSGKTFDTTDLASGFTLASGQTLSGTGTVAGKVNITSTAKVSPGDSAGILHGDSMDWGSNGRYVWEIFDAGDTSDAKAGVNFDKIALTSILNVSATNAATNTKFHIDITSPSNGTVDIANFDKLQNYEWIIATAGTGGLTNFDPSKFDLVDIVSNNTSGVNGNPDGSWSIFASGDEVHLRYSAAPEPGSLTLLGLGIGGWLARRPSRRKRVNA